MNKISIAFFLLLAACSGSDRYNPDKQLDLKEKNDILDRVIQYQEKGPTHLLKLYYKSGPDHFFLVTRRAPSLHEKYVAIGGRLRIEGDSTTEYEEIFRTWKLVPDTLNKRGALLFDKMVKGESLDPYLTRNSKDVEYIEFPDDHVSYDKENRKWKSDQFGSIEEMIKDSTLNR